MRFWVFDNVKSQLSVFSSLPVWIQGGLGGGAGGFAEVTAHSLVRGQLPQAAALGSQTLKLFLCFGTYTFLSTSLSDELPPKPFWWCWVMGATAGGVGSAIVSRLEGVKGRELWTRATPKGMLTIGTVIAVQVTSCAELLHRVKGRRSTCGREPTISTEGRVLPNMLQYFQHSIAAIIYRQ